MNKSTLKLNAVVRDAFIKRYGRLTRAGSSGMVLYTIGGTGARGIDLLGALIIVRNMPIAAFASYSSAVTFAPIFSLIFISGILPAFLAIASDATPQTLKYASERLYRVMFTQNRVLLLAGYLLSTIYFMRIGQHGMQLLIMPALTIGMAFNIAMVRIQELYFQLNKQYSSVAIGSLLQSSLRLLGVGVVFVKHDAAIILAMTTTAAIAINYYYYRTLLGRTKIDSAEGVIDLFPTVARLRKRSVPIDIYQALSGQVYYWILAFATGANEVARYSALARLGQLLYPFTLIAQGILVPGFARAREDKLAPKYRLYAMIIAVGLAPIAAICIVWPRVPLALIGNRYGNLGSAVPIYALGLMAWLTADLIDGLLRARGKLLKPIYTIGYDVGVLGLAVLALRPKSAIAMMSVFAIVAVFRLLKFVVFAERSFVVSP